MIESFPNSTRRISFGQIEITDAGFIVELMNSPEWIQHIGDRHIYHREVAVEYIRDVLIPMYKKNKGLWRISLHSGEPIGMCGLVQRDYLDYPDIGFAILPTYFRQGLMYEACFSVVEYFESCFENTPLGGITSEDNIASQKLLEKLGLHYEKQITHNGETSRLYIRPASPNHE